MADEQKVEKVKLKLVNVGVSPQYVNTVEEGAVIIRPGEEREVEVDKATADLLKKQAESDKNPATLQPADMAKKTMREREAEEAEKQKAEDDRQKAIEESQKRALEEQHKAQQPKKG